jgi:hypothetical protein
MDDNMRQYFLTLPVYIQESVNQSGMRFSNMKELEQFVEKYETEWRLYSGAVTLRFIISGPGTQGISRCRSGLPGFKPVPLNSLPYLAHNYHLTSSAIFFI